jgi:hypothetical protein
MILFLLLISLLRRHLSGARLDAKVKVRRTNREARLLQRSVARAAARKRRINSIYYHFNST